MIIRSPVILIVCLLLIWSYFARPAYDFCWIVLRRGLDQVAENAHQPPASELFDNVIALNTQTVDEIDAYIHSRRDKLQQSPGSLGLDFSSSAAYLKSTDPLRSVLASSIGFPLTDAIHGTDFSSVKQVAIEEDDLATYTLLSIPTLPGVVALGTFIVPKKHGAKMPLIIAASGRGDMPDRPAQGRISLMPYNDDRDLARGAVERGWAVYEPIFAFYGKGYANNVRDILAMRAQEAGTTLPSIEISKIIRTIDYLTARPDIDPRHLAMVGVSYGGFYTLYTTALDSRIQVATVAGYFNDRADILDGSEPYGFFDWRFPNSLGILVDPHIVSLICPRPLQIQAGSQDQLFPVEGARQTVPQAREFYSKLHFDSNFDYNEFVGRHEFNGIAAWEFVDKAFKNNDRAVDSTAGTRPGEGLSANSP